MVNGLLNPNITPLGEKTVTGSSTKLKNANKKRNNENFEKQRKSLSCPKDHSTQKIVA